MPLIKYKYHRDYKLNISYLETKLSYISNLFFNYGHVKVNKANLRVWVTYNRAQQLVLKRKFYE